MSDDRPADNCLIRISPFTKDEDGYYAFSAKDPVSGERLEEYLNLDTLLQEMPALSYTAEDVCGAILTCSCGVPGCAGLWKQAFRVSGGTVHWSVRKYQKQFDFYFDREVYEMGMVRMFHDLVANPRCPGAPEDCECPRGESLKRELAVQFDKRPSFWDMWKEVCGDEFIDLRDVDEEKDVAEESDIEPVENMPK